MSNCVRLHMLAVPFNQIALVDGMQSNGTLADAFTLWVVPFAKGVHVAKAKLDSEEANTVTRNQGGFSVILCEKDYLNACISILEWLDNP